MSTVTVTNSQIAGRRVGAALLTDEALWDHADSLIEWLAGTSDAVLQSKFCQEVAWFREINWELQRRNLLVVH